MPPNDYGERLASLETQVERLERDMTDITKAVDGLRGIVGKLGVAWWIVAAAIVFGSTIAGNVIAAHLTR